MDEEDEGKAHSDHCDHKTELEDLSNVKVESFHQPSTQKDTSSTRGDGHQTWKTMID